MCRGCGRQRLSECTCSLADKMREGAGGARRAGQDPRAGLPVFHRPVGQPGAAGQPDRQGLQPPGVGVPLRGRPARPGHRRCRRRRAGRGRAQPALAAAAPPQRRSIPPSSSASPMSSATSTDAAERRRRPADAPAAGAADASRADSAQPWHFFVVASLAAATLAVDRLGAHGARASGDAQRHGVRGRRRGAGRLSRHRAAGRRAPPPPRRRRGDAARRCSPRRRWRCARSRSWSSIARWGRCPRPTSTRWRRACGRARCA